MNQLDLDYQNLLKDILDNGVEKNTRNGKVLSVFGRSIRYKFKDGKFPLLTTKKMAWKSIVTELLWFLRGDTSIKYLLENDCNIWTGDAYENYCKKVIRDKDVIQYLKSYSRDENGVPTIELYSKEEFINKIKTDDEFAKKFGDLGPVYGKQWRKWKTKEYPTNEPADYSYIDQIKNLINELKTNPDSRRLMVSAWNVGEIDQMVLPPCHYGFQVYTRELSFEERLRLVNYDKEKFNSIDEWITWYNNEPNEFYYMGINYTKDTALTDLGVPNRAISLMWNQRSVDTPLGLPFNIASYGLLLEIIAKEVKMVPEELIGNLGDCHIYLNQIDGVKEQIVRTPYELPKINFNTEWWDEPFFKAIYSESFCKCLLEEDIQLYDYQSHPAIKMPLSN